MATFNFELPDRGMSSRPDFQRQKGFLRDSPNCRFMPGIGAISRNGSDLIANVSALDPDIEYRFENVGDHLIAIGDLEDSSDPSLLIQAFNGDGDAITIRRQATLAFENGSIEIVPDMQIQGVTSVAHALVEGVSLDSGTWAGGDAAGTLTIRHQTPGTDFEAGEDLRQLGTLTKYAEVDGTTGTTQIEVGNEYLGTDVSTIRMYAIEDSVFVWNTAVEVEMLPAPSGTVTKELIDYDKLINRTGTTVGQIYKTVLTALGNPAGYYLCTSPSGSTGSPPDPPGQYRRIPKPDQEDALFDPATMPHRLLRISDTIYEWQRLPWEPRLSGGDVDGTDAQGNEVIRNPPVLKGQTIQALTLAQASMFLFLNNKKVVISVRRDFFNLWLDDVLEIKGSDRVVDELIESNTGAYLYATPSGSGVFIQCEEVQAQFSTRGGSSLIAGGTDGPYNGDLRVVSRFKPNQDVAPVSWGNLVAMVDAQKIVRTYQWRGYQDDFNFVPIGEPSFVIHDDFVQDTAILLKVINSHLYVVMDDGKAWLMQVWGTERDGSLRVTWTYTQFDEPIQYLWGYSQYIRILTTYDTGMSLLQHIDQETVPDANFDIPPRLDRMEQIEGVFDASDNTTGFTMQTTPDVDETRMFLLHDLDRINFIGGVSEITVGSTLAGASSGAQGVVYRISKTGDWGRPTLIGGHGAGLNATISHGAGLEVGRTIVTNRQIVTVGSDETEVITDTIFGNFNSQTPPIGRCDTIRWPEIADTFNDDPPLITDAAYLAVRSALVNILNKPEAQTCILSGNYYLGVGGNEGFGGPGTTPGLDKTQRMIDLATDLMTHLRANVINGDLINYCSSALTRAYNVAPDYPEGTPGSVNEWLQVGKRLWIQWAKDHEDEGAVLDLHLLCGGLEEGFHSTGEAIQNPMLPILRAVFAYADTIGYDPRGKWISTEFAPVYYKPQSDTEGAVALMRSMFQYGYSYSAKLLCYGVIFENTKAGATFVWCSVLNNSDFSRKEPFATALEEQTSIPTADNSAYGHVYTRRVGTTEFEENEAMLIGSTQTANVSGTPVGIGRRGDLIIPTSVDGQVVYFAGRYGPLSADAGDVTIEHLLGRTVQARAVLPSIWAGMSRDRVMISSMSSFHSETTDYEVVRTYIGFDGEVRNQFTAKVMGSMRHGETPVHTGNFTMLAGADGRTMQLAIESNTPGRFRFCGMEFEYERVSYG